MVEGVGGTAGRSISREQFYNLPLVLLTGMCIPPNHNSNSPSCKFIALCGDPLLA